MKKILQQLIRRLGRWLVDERPRPINCVTYIGQDGQRRWSIEAINRSTDQDSTKPERYVP